jgi:hypothetical protein
MKFTAATLTALTLLTPVLALPSGDAPTTRALRPLERDMTPRATFNEAEGKSPRTLTQLSKGCLLTWLISLLLRPPRLQHPELHQRHQPGGVHRRGD